MQFKVAVGTQIDALAEHRGIVMIYTLLEYQMSIICNNYV